MIPRNVADVNPHRGLHSARILAAGVTMVAILALSVAGWLMPRPRPQAWSATPQAPGAPRPPECAIAAPAVPAPDLLSDFPWPAGAVIVQVRPLAISSVRGVWVRAFAPLPFSDLAHDFVARLPEAGYPVEGGEAEADEIEVLFSGPALHGGLSTGPVPGCPNASRLDVSVVAAGPP